MWSAAPLGDLDGGGKKGGKKVAAGIFNKAATGVKEENQPTNLLSCRLFLLSPMHTKKASKKRRRQKEKG